MSAPCIFTWIYLEFTLSFRSLLSSIMSPYSDGQWALSDGEGVEGAVGRWPKVGEIN
jgi:hypothetical protein